MNQTTQAWAELQRPIKEIRARYLAGRLGWRPSARVQVVGEPGAVPDFASWLQAVTPGWDWQAPHLRAIFAALQRVTEGGSRRLMIYCPPRHGKSEGATIRYPVWRLERDPALRICVGCYNQGFAERFGRRSRRLAEARGLLAGSDRAAAKEWETPQGGVYRSCGVGSPPMGEGFNLIVIDDPVKSREEAESEAYRDRCWEWYTDLYTRQEPGCAIVLIMTRWHERDLAGLLLEDGREPWEVVNLPALAEPADPLGRSEGEPLWPARYDAAALAGIRDALGAYAFSALYQQSPVPREGNLFKRAWFTRFTDAAPAHAARVRCWDLAASADGDYTAGVLLARDGGTYYVEHVRRGRWTAGERDRIIRATAEEDGKRVAQVFEEEPGSAGKSQTAALVTLLDGWPVHSQRPTGEKTIRAMPLAAQCEAGNVALVRGEWNRALLDELCAFPAGAHDDQVDAASGGHTWLAARGGPGTYAAGGQRTMGRGYVVR